VALRAVVDFPVEHEAETPSPPQKLERDEQKWARAVEALRQLSPRHGKSLSHARFLGASPDGVLVSFPADAAFHRAQIVGMSRSMVEAELTKVFGRPTKLMEDTLGAGLTAPQSIAEVEQVSRTSREHAIESKVKQHPAILNILRHLGGQVEHISYLEPLERKPKLVLDDDTDVALGPDSAASD
jgi:hypothetical protein